MICEKNTKTTHLSRERMIEQFGTSGGNSSEIRPNNNLRPCRTTNVVTRTANSGATAGAGLSTNPMHQISKLRSATRRIARAAIYQPKKQTGSTHKAIQHSTLRSDDDLAY